MPRFIILAIATTTIIESKQLFLTLQRQIMGDIWSSDNRARDVALEEVVQHVSETKSDLLNFTQTPSTDN